MHAYLFSNLNLEVTESYEGQFEIRELLSTVTVLLWNNLSYRIAELHFLLNP